VEFPERINTTPAATVTATNAGSSAHERQRISRIRLATERMPCVWLWSVTIHLTGGLPTGASKDLDTLDTAKAEFKTAWEALKARTTPKELAAAYKDMNIRDDDDNKSPDDK
jgi:hypothetical protein